MSTRNRSFARIITAAVTVALSLSLAAGTHVGSARAAGTSSVVLVGTSSLSGIGKGTASSPLGRLRPQTLNDSAATLKTYVQSPFHATVPNPPGQSVVPPGSEYLGGFNAMSNLDQAMAGTGIYAGTQYDLTPPDQGLCTNGTDVVETINTAVAVYDTNGNVLSSPVPLNQFFGDTPEYDPNTDLYGNFTSDPRCYYDTATSRWFLTIADAPVDPTTGNFLTTSNVDIAVSQTSDPTGSWSIYRLDVTDAAAPGCPCFGDEPLLGADANGIYISTNQFTLDTEEFVQNRIYAVSKSDLENNVSTPAEFDIAPPDLPASSEFPGGPAYTVQPATVPGTSFETANNGTEYFTSSLEYTGYWDNRIAVWALSNTGSLNSTPALHLTYAIVGTEVYGMGGSAEMPVGQKSGPRPLAQWIHQNGGKGSTAPEYLTANDDTMQQLVFAAGKLWTAVDTMALNQNGALHVGIAYFIVNPTSSGTSTAPTISGTIANQGYVSIGGQNSAFFPAIGVNDQGKGEMAFAISGPSYYPSTGYAPIDATHGAGAIHLSGAGAAPMDTFDGYAAFLGDGVARWGDYSAAVAAPDGSIWLASEYIPAGPRDLFANWGTFISHVTP